MSDLDTEPADLPPAPWTAPRRELLGNLVKLAFGVAVLAFGVAFVVSRWPQLSAALARAEGGWIVLACAFAIAGQWTAMLAFRAALTATSRRLPTVDVARVYFVSQLAKYIPGSVWPIVAVTQMCRRYGVARASAALAGVLAMVFSVTVGFLVGVVLLLVGATGDAGGLWWLLALVPVAGAVLHPRLLVPVVDRVFRLLRREPVELALQGSTLRGALGWPVASWLLLGLQCWALVVALGGPLVDSLAGAVAGFALAYAVGTLVVISPAGAGVREAVLGLALATVIGSDTVDHDAVIVVVLLSRVLLAVLDFTQAGVAVLLARRWSLADEPMRTGG